MESSALVEEDSTQRCVQNVKKLSCSSNLVSLSRLLQSKTAPQRQQTSHVKKLLLFILLSIALVSFSHSTCAVPSINAAGFLRELDKTIANNSETPRNNHERVILMKNVYANRKLLVDPERMGDACTSEDIVILQGETGALPDGVPSFMVQIINLCGVGCPISDIHVSCGWFASTKLINPKLFKRVRFNDCVVNDKKPLKKGDSIVFEYANSFQYPLEISSVNACCL